MKEEWKGLIYHNNNYGKFYEVSNLGEIRNSRNKRVRKKNMTKNGYYQIGCSLGGKENRATFKIHRAVSENFIPNLNEYPIINHKDGNKLNNNVNNLEWCTYSYNTNHAIKLGLIDNSKRSGKNSTSSKLSQSDVEYIRDNYKAYDKFLGSRGLGKKFDVCHDTILRVVKNKTWKQN